MTLNTNEEFKEQKEAREMSVAKGVMLSVPQKSSEQFLSCFKKSNVDIDRLKKLASIHEGKNKG